MDDITKIIKSLEESALFIKSVSETIRNEAKEQRGGFLGMLLGRWSKKLFFLKKYSLILASMVTGCISISDFASLLGIPLGIASSAIGLQICAIINKSIIEKKKKKHEKIVLLAKSNLNRIEVLIYKALTD